MVTADGTEHEIDVLIVATGFHHGPADRGAPAARARPSLAEHFAEVGMQAYKGATVQLPNLFFIVGPNTGLGHSSMVFMIESRWPTPSTPCAGCRASGVRAVEPTREAQRHLETSSAACSAPCGTVVDARAGTSTTTAATTLWPRTTYTFRKLTSQFDSEAYVATPARSTDSRKVSS